jgi:RNA recognition motif-containing protein
MTIYVGNLSFQAEREDLLDLFGQYGEVASAASPSTVKPAASAVSLSWSSATTPLNKRPSTTSRMWSGWVA